MGVSVSCFQFQPTQMVYLCVEACPLMLKPALPLRCPVCLTSSQCRFSASNLWLPSLKFHYKILGLSRFRAIFPAVTFLCCLGLWKLVTVPVLSFWLASVIESFVLETLGLCLMHCTCYIVFITLTDLLLSVMF